MLPWLIGMAVFILYPMMRSLILSFTEYNLVRAAKFVGLEHYRYIFEDTVLRKAIANTGLYAIVYIPLGIGIAMFLAFLTSTKRIKHTRIFEVIYFAPYIMPIVAIGTFGSFEFAAC